MKQQWVSDDVWRQLDPRAGALAQRQLRRIVAASAAAAVILVAGFAIDRSGFVRARIAYDDKAGLAGFTTVKPPLFGQEIPVKNTGWTTIRVTGIGQDGPGLRLVRPGDTAGMKQLSELRGTPLPFDLHPGQTVILAIGYWVTDCDAVSVGAVPDRRAHRPAVGEADDKHSHSSAGGPAGQRAIGKPAHHGDQPARRRVAEGQGGPGVSSGARLGIADRKPPPRHWRHHN